MANGRNGRVGVAVLNPVAMAHREGIEFALLHRIMVGPVRERQQKPKTATEDSVQVSCILHLFLLCYHSIRMVGILYIPVYIWSM